VVCAGWLYLRISLPSSFFLFRGFLQKTTSPALLTETKFKRSFLDDNDDDDDTFLLTINNWKSSSLFL